MHNIVLSMPAPTSPNAVLGAARTFAREKFALQHRYALVLHIDQKHPHVHLVVKAENEQGKRLNIDRARLREWRQDFAQILRDQGIEGNASSRAARGKNKRHSTTAYEHLRKHTTSYRWLAEIRSVEDEILEKRTVPPERGRERLVETRARLVSGWGRVADQLDAQGEGALAGQMREYLRGLPKVFTDRERLGISVLAMKPEEAREKARRARNVEPPRSRTHPVIIGRSDPFSDLMPGRT